jgi:hypothetical protein
MSFGKGYIMEEKTKLKTTSKELVYDAPESAPIKLEFNRESVPILTTKWAGPESDSVDEIHSSFALQYLTPEQRIYFVNECHRVLKVGGKLTVVVPYWSSSRAYGDLEVQWPPVVESWFSHLNAKWRNDNSVDSGYTCDFDFTWGYGMHPLIQSRNLEYQQHALTFWKEAAQDFIATGTKR